MSDLGVHEHGVDQLDGPVFVLLHAGVADAAGWEPVAGRLAAAGCRVIAPDLRGFGSSPDPAVDFRHADDVLAMLDELDVTTPAALVGWSMSGTIALELAIEHPERWSALALVCSVPEPLLRSTVVEEAWAREEQLIEAGDLDGAIRNDIQTWGAGPQRSVDDLDPAIVEYMTEIAREQLERAVRATGEALDGDRDAIGRLDELTVPLLVITAHHDTPCHEDAARVLLDRVADARRVHVLGAAHMAPMEQPNPVAAALLTLVADD